jgi:hypothetical protein
MAAGLPATADYALRANPPYNGSIIRDIIL